MHVTSCVLWCLFLLHFVHFSLLLSVLRELYNELEHERAVRERERTAHETELESTQETHERTLTEMESTHLKLQREKQESTDRLQQQIQQLQSELEEKIRQLQQLQTQQSE